MLQAIGMVICAYVLLRCFEMLTLNPTHFESNATRRVVQGLAVLVILFTAFAAYSLMQVGHVASATDALVR